MSVVQQSHGEIIRVFTDWKSLYAPKNLIDDEQTASLLVDYVVKNYSGIVSFTALNAAVAALSSQVLKSEQQVAAEAAERAEARMRRDYLDSKKPQGYDPKELSRQATERAASQSTEKLATLNASISREINGYSRGNAFGSVDYIATESGQIELRRVASQHNLKTVAGAEAALEAVRVAKSKLP